MPSKARKASTKAEASKQAEAETAPVKSSKKQQKAKAADTAVSQCS
jgi:hypothetical protein